MTTLAEIEKAADLLPPEQRQALLVHLSRNLAFRPGSTLGKMPAPPDVPIEELRRIHALIEADFSQLDPKAW
jgi:hypothetical protein